MIKSESREALTLENKGEKIFAVFHRPLNKSRVPALLICSGLNGNKCGKYRLFVRLATALTEQGIAVLRFDYRGSGDSEGEFSEITLDAELSDTLLCLDYLKNHPAIDSHQIGLLGRSMGGVVALMTANKVPSIKSLALWAPVYSSQPWQELWLNYQKCSDSHEKSKMLKKVPGGIPNPTFLKEFFSLDIKKMIENLKAIPLIHLHGLLDDIVSIDDAKGYQEVRSQAEALSEFIRLPKSDHDFSDLTDQNEALEKTMTWFKKTLKGA